MDTAVVKAVLLLMLLTTTWNRMAHATIELEDNGYTGVVVDIGSDVAEDPALLKRLEYLLTKTSVALYGSTRNLLYFKEITIRLPREWQTIHNIVSLSDIPVGAPDVIVDLPNQAAGNSPYVRQFAGCGRQGLYVHLTPDYVLNDTVTNLYGAAGSTLVREWGQYRWGLFHEYATKAEEQFYRYNNTWHPTRCASNEGDIVNAETDKACTFDFTTGMPSENCAFVPSERKNSDLDSVVEFCDHHETAPEHLRHNKLAPTLQNKLCNSRSAWEVMRTHSDFNPMPNNFFKTAQPSVDQLRPSFRYVRSGQKVRVLILDTSSSMVADDRIGSQRKAVSQMILNHVEIGSRLGIVSFGTHSTVRSPIVSIDSESTKEFLLDAVPSSTGGGTGGTGIAGALNAAMDLLAKEGDTRERKVILITDGHPNGSPRIADVMPIIIQRGVVVHSIAISQDADDAIANLADSTGGKNVFYTGSTDSTALIDGLADIFATEDSNLFVNREVPISILSDAREVKRSNPFNRTFYIDSTLGRDTFLTFSYSRGIAVTINSPKGPYADATLVEYPELNILRVFLGEDITPGLWSYQVTIPRGPPALMTDITVSITSKPKGIIPRGNPVLKTNSWMDLREDITFSPKTAFAVFAQVTLGRTPVLGATVIADIDRPFGQISIELYDNGIGSDIIADDGIYAATVTAKVLAGSGRYNIKIRVVARDGQARAVESRQGLVGGAFERRTAAVPVSVPLDGFHRISVPGEFRVHNYHTPFGDLLPPARITDFCVTSFDPETLQARLVWTAVGDDFAHGRGTVTLQFESSD